LFTRLPKTTITLHLVTMNTIKVTGYPKLGPNVNFWTSFFTFSDVLFTVHVMACEINGLTQFGVLLESDGHRKIACEFDFLFQLFEKETMAKVADGRMKVEPLSRMSYTSDSTPFNGEQVWQFFNIPLAGKIICLPSEVELLFQGDITKKPHV
jgi:hypothetical protein